MEIEKMDAEKWRAFVAKEFDKLVMCKAGKLKTEYTDRTGPTPGYNHEERMEILEHNDVRIKAELKGMFNDLIDADLNVPAVYAKYSLWDFLDYTSVDVYLESVLSKFELFNHPDAAAHEVKRKEVNDEVNVRELALRKEAENITRDFCIGIKDPTQLNTELDKFEQKEF
jgi:hypothetical protein